MYYPGYGDISSYTKFGTIVASNAFVYTNAKNQAFLLLGNAWFLLVEALPQSPQNTEMYSGNTGKIQRLRDFANRCETVNIRLFQIPYQ